jgi:hypothetical protein
MMLCPKSNLVYAYSIDQSEQPVNGSLDRCSNNESMVYYDILLLRAQGLSNKEHKLSVTFYNESGVAVRARWSGYYAMELTGRYRLA